MIAYFPRPYPDEILYSLLARYRRHTCELSFKRSCRALFGKRGVTASVYFQSHIRQLYQRIKHLFPYSEQDLVHNHTFLPFFTAYTTPEVAQRAYESSLKNRGGALNVLLGTAANSVELPSVLKFCPACLNSDFERYGETYWRRLHQLPGVLGCHEHSHPLYESLVAVTQRNRHVFIAATRRNCRNSGNSGALVYENYSGVFDDIARAYQRIVSGKIRMESHEQRTARYFALLKKKGFVKGRDSVAQEKLFESFSNYYSSELLEILFSSVDISDDSCWLKAISRKHRKSFSPVRHFLFSQFLNALPDARKKKLPKICVYPKYVPPRQQRKKNREKWLSLQAANSDLSKTQLRKLNPKLYTWLYRHDKQWLSENSPALLQSKGSPGHVNWEQRDAEMLEAVRQAVIDIHMEIPLRRVTLSRIGIRLGCLANLERKLDYYPRTKAFLKERLESVENFQVRRIFYIARTEYCAGRRSKDWEIVRLAGLKTPVKPDLEKAVALALKTYSDGFICRKRPSTI